MQHCQKSSQCIHYRVNFSKVERNQIGYIFIAISGECNHDMGGPLLTFGGIQAVNLGHVRELSVTALEDAAIPC